MRVTVLGLLLLTVAASASSAVRPLARRDVLRYRGGGKQVKPTSTPQEAQQVSLPGNALASVKAVSILSLCVGSWVVLKDPKVTSWFQNLSPIHKYFPFARHQVLIFAAWLMNQIAVRVPGRSDGTSWKTTTSIRFFTPSGYAFAIWAPIFLGEFLFTVYQLFSKQLSPGSQLYFAKLAPPLAQAFTAQSLWCLAFRPWIGKMQFVPTALLAFTGIGLFQVHKIVRLAATAGVMKPWEYSIVHLPLSLHFGWITCATLVNLNGWFAVAPLRTGDKLGLALASMNIAVTIGSKLAFMTGDPVIPLVVAWALYAVADDLKPGVSMLRKNRLVGDDALDALEISGQVSATIVTGVAAFLILYKVLLATGVATSGDGEKLVDAVTESALHLMK